MQTLLHSVEQPSSLFSDSKSGQTAEIVAVTPAIAKDWLKNMAKNRAITASGNLKIARYSELMKSGDWFLCEPLLFDVEGRLIQGQHRLHALIKSGLTIEFWVITGVDPEAMAVLDSGKPRTVQQSLSIAGIECSALDVAIVNSMFLKPGVSAAAGNGHNRQEISRLFLKHRAAITFAKQKMGRPASISCQHASVRAAIARAYYHVDRELLARFVWIVDGNPTENVRDHIPHALRSAWLSKKNYSVGTAVRVELAVKTSWAIDQFDKNLPFQKLKDATTILHPVPDFD